MVSGWILCIAWQAVVYPSVSHTHCSLFIEINKKNQGKQTVSVKFTVDEKNNLDRNGPLEIIWSSPLLRACLVGSGCSGLFPAKSWTPPRTEMPQSLHATCSTVRPPSWWKIFLLISNQNFPCCYLHLLPLVLSPCNSEKSLPLASLYPLTR